LETAIYELYDFAAIQEYNVPFSEATRKTMLQEKLELAAVVTEHLPRYIVHQAQLVLDSRDTNIAILRNGDVQHEVLLNCLLPRKLTEIQQYPLVHRLGLIHSIPEKDFSMASATITDVGFLGLFSKALVKVLSGYTRAIKQSNQDEAKFQTLVDKLITAFIYRLITMQKTIQIMLSHKKNELLNLVKNASLSSENADQDQHHDSQNLQSTQSHICYASKCRLLHAQGILFKAMYCTNNKNMYSGCYSESLRQKMTTKMEQEILCNLSPNITLAPLLQYLNHTTSLQHFWQLMGYLNKFQTHNRRNDYIYGTVRYMANTLGINILDTSTATRLDQPMTDIDIKKAWHMGHL